MSHGNFPDPDTIVHAVGARPNFVKMAPVIDALARARRRTADRRPHGPALRRADVRGDPRRPRLPAARPLPRRRLGLARRADGQGADRVRADPPRATGPALVVVAGDVNSTLACALAAAKLGIPVAHVESGLRSGDWTMPEEINRVLTDRLSDLLLTHSPEAAENLAARGHRPGARPLRRQHDDRLAAPLRARGARARASGARLGVRGARVRCSSRSTGRRTSTTRARLAGDRRRALRARARRRRSSSRSTRAPARGWRPAARSSGSRRRACAASSRSATSTSSRSQAGAGAIVTDSGGVQEEAAALGVPCFTLRANTERPVTITPRHEHAARRRSRAPAATSSSRRRAPTPCAIPLWDGQAAERAAAAVLAEFPSVCAPTDRARRHEPSAPRSSAAPSTGSTWSGTLAAVERGHRRGQLHAAHVDQRGQARRDARRRADARDRRRAAASSAPTARASSGRRKAARRPAARAGGRHRPDGRAARPRRAARATASTSSARAPTCSTARSSGSASATRPSSSPAPATATSPTPRRPQVCAGDPPQPRRHPLRRHEQPAQGVLPRRVRAAASACPSSWASAARSTSSPA